MPSKDPATPKVLDRSGLKFSTAFVRYRDLYKAAEKAGIPKNQAVRTFNKPEVQEEIDRQDEAVRMERARQTVHVETLANPLLDGELVKVIMLDAEKCGSLKLEAIRLGMVVLGRIQSGNTRSLDLPGGEGTADHRPGNFYQAMVTLQQVATPLMPDAAAPPPGAPSQPAPAAANTTTSPAPSPAPPSSPPARRVGSIKIG